MPEAVPGHPQPQPLTLRGMHFELSRVRTHGCLLICDACAVLITRAILMCSLLSAALALTTQYATLAPHKLPRMIAPYSMQACWVPLCTTVCRHPSHCLRHGACWPHQCARIQSYCLQGPWRASPLAQASGEDQQEETSELAEIQSMPAADLADPLDSPVRPALPQPDSHLSTHFTRLGNAVPSRHLPPLQVQLASIQDS